MTSGLVLGGQLSGVEGEEEEREEGEEGEGGVGVAPPTGGGGGAAAFCKCWVVTSVDDGL